MPLEWDNHFVFLVACPVSVLVRPIKDLAEGNKAKHIGRYLKRMLTANEAQGL